VKTLKTPVLVTGTVNGQLTGVRTADGPDPSADARSDSPRRCVRRRTLSTGHRSSVRWPMNARLSMPKPGSLALPRVSDFRSHSGQTPIWRAP